MSWRLQRSRGNWEGAHHDPNVEGRCCAQSCPRIAYYFGTSVRTPVRTALTPSVHPTLPLHEHSDTPLSPKEKMGDHAERKKKREKKKVEQAGVMTHPVGYLFWALPLSCSLVVNDERQVSYGVVKLLTSQTLNRCALRSKT